MMIDRRPENGIRRVYRGALVGLAAWSCRAHDTKPGAEEASGGNDIVFTRRGSFRRLMRGESVVADPATVLFFPRHEPYRVSHPAPGDDACIVLSLADGVLDEFEDPMTAGAAALQPRQALQLRRLLAAIGPAGGRGDMVPGLDVEETALDLAGALLRSAARGRSAAHRRNERRGGRAGDPHESRWGGRRDPRRRGVERVKLLLASHSHERLTLPIISREAAYSPYHLCRLFQKGTGFTIHRYLNRLRLLRALEMLEPGIDLTSVALETGFSSHSHFTSAFRREFGLPPSRVARGLAGRGSRRIRKNLKARALPPA